MQIIIRRRLDYHHNNYYFLRTAYVVIMSHLISFNMNLHSVLYFIKETDDRQTAKDWKSNGAIFWASSMTYSIVNSGRRLCGTIDMVDCMSWHRNGTFPRKFQSNRMITFDVGVIDSIIHLKRMSYTRTYVQCSTFFHQSRQFRIHFFSSTSVDEKWICFFFVIFIIVLNANSKREKNSDSFLIKKKSVSYYPSNRNEWIIKSEWRMEWRLPINNNSEHETWTPTMESNGIFPTYILLNKI